MEKVSNELDKSLIKALRLDLSKIILFWYMIYFGSLKVKGGPSFTIQQHPRYILVLLWEMPTELILRRLCHEKRWKANVLWNSLWRLGIDPLTQAKTDKRGRETHIKCATNHKLVAGITKSWFWAKRGRRPLLTQWQQVPTSGSKPTLKEGNWIVHSIVSST